MSLPESASSLLVHLGPGCHTIHCHEEDLARLDDSEEHLQVMENVSENLFLRDAEVNVLIIWVGALVDDAIHIQVEIVELWNLREERKKIIIIKIIILIVSCMYMFSNINNLFFDLFYFSTKNI